MSNSHRRRWKHCSRYIKDNTVFDTGIFLDGSSIYRIAVLDNRKIVAYNIGSLFDSLFGFLFCAL